VKNKHKKKPKKEKEKKHVEQTPKKIIKKDIEQTPEKKKKKKTCCGQGSWEKETQLRPRTLS